MLDLFKEISADAGINSNLKLSLNSFCYWACHIELLRIFFEISLDLVAGPPRNLVQFVELSISWAWLCLCSLMSVGDSQILPRSVLSRVGLLFSSSAGEQVPRASGSKQLLLVLL